MVFPSLPIYLDPSNWSQQQPNQQAEIGTQNPQIPHPSQPPPPTAATVGGGGYHGCIKPRSTAERARLAKIHQPDAALKCPRCESTNTKFCYYNNYSLSQPRHFCKTCRRYWTKGGALRNVPLGGGCRKNKRSKGSIVRSKSPMKAGGSCSASANSSSSCCISSADVMTCLPTTPTPTHLPFLTTSHHSYSDYVSRTTGLHFGAFPTSLVARNGNNTSATGIGSDVEFQIGTGSSGGNNGASLLSNGLTEEWRLPNLQQVHQQQFPFLTQNGMFKFNGEDADPQKYVRDGGRFCSKALDSSDSGIMPQLNAIKMEENQGLSLSKYALASSGNDLFWNGSGNAWSEVPSFTSITSHML